MPVISDPYNRELNHVIHAVDLHDKHVLEVGCGSGRMTTLYQHLVASVVGIDVSASALNKACNNAADNADFALASAVHLPFRDKAFDVVIFAWSF